MRNLVDLETLLLVEVLGHDLHLVGHLDDKCLALNLHHSLDGLLTHESAPSLELSHALSWRCLLILEDLLSELLANMRFDFEEVVLILLLGGDPRVS